jgi:hypothetical protein
MCNDEIDTPRIDLSSKEARERLSAAASKAFFNIMIHWKVSDEDARQLLGGLSSELFGEMKRNPERLLDADVLTRISYLIGMFKALNILYSEKLADAWMQMPNTNPIFGGQTPLAFVLNGELPAMQTVRQLLEACREGM